MKTKKKYNSYRDLPDSKVTAYADKHSLNIDTPENYKEAAKACFNEMKGLTPVNHVKVLIKIEGGTIQAIIANNPSVEIVVLEYDDEGVNEWPVQVNKYQPDTVLFPEERFHEHIFKGELTENEEEAQEKLKDLDF